VVVVDLLSVINDLVEEKGLDRSVLSSIVAEGMMAAYVKKYPQVKLQIDYDKKNGDISVLALKTVVSSVKDELKEIGLKKAIIYNKNIKVGEEIWVKFESPVGRIEILTAKQMISDKIRKIEALAVYNMFKPSEGEIIYGTVYKLQSNGALIKIQENYGFLPKSLSILEEKLIINSPIRVLLKEVLIEPRNENQLILDRSSPEFIKKLLFIEIPEIFERIVEIKNIVRIAGYKSKIIVSSSDRNIDPVGTCIGIGGVRIKPILKELCNEKVDIISQSDSLETMVRDSLKPAKVDRVEIEGPTKAIVWLDDEQRAIAIGKLGQNIALATKLLGVDIKLAEKVNIEDFELA
jgi:N utilization substance protein A